MNAKEHATLICGILLVRLFEFVDYRLCCSRQLRVRRCPVGAGPAGPPLSGQLGLPALQFLHKPDSKLVSYITSCLTEPFTCSYHLYFSTLVAHSMDSLLGSHKAQDGRLLRPKLSFTGRHSAESAPAAFENRTPHTRPHVAFSESEELQADPDRGTGKGRAGSAERPHQSLQECKGQLPPLNPCTAHHYITMNAQANSLWSPLFALTLFTNYAFTRRYN
jgi:hypothetical protein